MSHPLDPRPCQFCGAILKYDGWDMVHFVSGMGEGSDPADDPQKLIAEGRHPYLRKRDE